MFRFYSKPSNSKVRVAVVGKEINNELCIAVARCSQKDQFCKKTGRELAEKRLENQEIFHKVALPECSAYNFLLIAQGVVSEVIKTKKIKK